MIDQIKLQTKETQVGRRYECATLWIAGIPFSADLNPSTEARIMRIVEESGCDFVDARKSNDRH